MFQAAAAFGGGIYLKQKLDNVQLPALRRVDNTARTFTLSIRVLAASVPGLEAPGLLSHQRPSLEASLGSSKKETEFADFAPAKDDRGASYAKECPWRFGDTLTFKVKPEDLVGPGLRLSLHVRRDIVLGLVQFEMRSTEVAVGNLDLRQRLLPACVHEKSDAAGGWESPLMLIPLVQVDGESAGQANLPQGQGQGHEQGGPGAGLLGGGAEGSGLRRLQRSTAATVAVIFNVDVDPETLLNRNQGPSLAQRFEEGVDGMMTWINKQVAAGDCSASTAEGASCDAVGLLAKCRPERSSTATPVEKEISVRAASSKPSIKAALAQGPELSPEGWICHRGPNGRTFWHHEALGPPPWETAPSTSSGSRMLPRGQPVAEESGGSSPSSAASPTARMAAATGSRTPLNYRQQVSVLAAPAPARSPASASSPASAAASPSSNAAAATAAPRPPPTKQHVLQQQAVAAGGSGQFVSRIPGRAADVGYTSSPPASPTASAPATAAALGASIGPSYGYSASVAGGGGGAGGAYPGIAQAVGIQGQSSGFQPAAQAYFQQGYQVVQTHPGPGPPQPSGYTICRAPQAQCQYR